MTYIENALYDFVKSILTSGIRTLKDPKYLPYSLFLLLLVSTSTISVFIGDLTGYTVTGGQQDLLLYVELSAAIGFLIVGIFMGRLGTLIQMSSLLVITGALTAVWWLDIIPNTNDTAILVAALFYIVWIAIAAFSTFSLFRDLFENDVFGMILFLGKPEDDGRPMFRLIAFILIFVNAGLGYIIIQNGQDLSSTALSVSGLIIIITAVVAMIPLLNLQKSNDVFFTILTTFYMFTTIRVVLLAFRALSQSPGSTSLWDTLFSLFIALYTIQNAAVKGIKIGDLDDEELSVEEKLMNKEKSGLGLADKLTKFIGERGIVLIILGTVIGFHTMQVQSFLGRSNIFNQIEYTADADIVLLGYQVNLAISLLIYILSLIAFLLIPAFRRYANPEVRRITWAPEYDDLKTLAVTFKQGDMDWKSESIKLVGTISKNKLKGILSSNNTLEEVLAESVENLVEKANNIQLKKKSEE